MSAAEGTNEYPQEREDAWRGTNLDDGGHAGDDLKEGEPEEELLHGALLDGKVVELHHAGSVENLVEARDGVDILPQN